MPANFAFSTVGNVLYAGGQGLILVSLAKLGTPAMVGDLTLGLAITSPVMTLAGLELQAIQATDAGGEHTFATYLRVRLLTSIGALLLLIAIIYLTNLDLTKSLIILAFWLTKSADSVSDTVYGLLCRYERMDMMSWSLVARGLLSPVAFALTFHWTRSVALATLGLALSTVTVLVCYDWGCARRMLAAVSKDPAGPQSFLATCLNIAHRDQLMEVYRLALLAWPLGVMAALASVKVNIPRYFIAHQLGEHELGIFGAMAYLVVALETIRTFREAGHEAENGVISCRRRLTRVLSGGLSPFGCRIAPWRISAGNLICSGPPTTRDTVSPRVRGTPCAIFVVDGIGRYRVREWRFFQRADCREGSQGAVGHTWCRSGNKRPAMPVAYPGLRPARRRVDSDDCIVCRVARVWCSVVL